MNVEFRRMRLDDIAVIDEIETDLFDDAWSKSSFLYEIKNESYSFPYVLILDNSIAGYCVCWSYHNELHIGNVAIKKEYQGKGYGKLLMNKLFTLFPDYIQAYLEVNVSNDAAIGLYLKFGFNIYLTRKSYYANGEDALVMVKNN
jgi:[ribosomal protein S18]-alanine N-acetyltransferase